MLVIKKGTVDYYILNWMKTRFVADLNLLLSSSNSLVFIDL